MVTRPAESEAAFAEWVIQAAQLHGWRVAHFRPARTAAGWRTAVQGHIGSPDLLLARDGDVLLVELKTDRGQLRPDQRTWLDHLGQHATVWRPADRPAILARLRRTP
ncbi:VRR-NUC domain-containing protein [Pseudonocardia pini]|uniref:VRR-NUC domain-containing protein n=1 Tax=Pseudonocardia pini TaxID=2758030 RepID=UPI0015F04108|nr:VRR-NUC domain-containing protein [Pseudonocardia pini]